MTSCINALVQFRVLGPIEVSSDEGVAVPLGSGRERLVLARLLLAADRLVPTERLIDALWEDPPPTAKQQLQNLIAGLRRRLVDHDPHLIVTRPFGYELRMGRHSLDLVTFRQLVAEARALLERAPSTARADGAASDAARLLDQAVALWRGAPLSDAAPATSDTDTHALTRGLLEERITAVDLLVEALAGSGLHDDVLTVSAAHLADDPWNERLHEHRIRALAATGRRAEAGEAFLTVRRQLLDELGVEPGRALVDLNTSILEGADIAPSTDRRRPVPRELPALAWTLVGRDALREAVIGRLGAGARDERAGPPSIVVLVGVGGVGKTALAVDIGHVLADTYPDGTLHAALGDGPSGSADAHDVLGRFLRSLGVDQASIPVDPDERVALYRTTIDSKRVLVVLDNAMSETQVRRLLPTSSGSAAIVTARTKLAGLAGVRRETVPPLAPDAGAALLEALAGDEVSDEERAVLDEVVALCGHLPLALCVAGAKLATNSSLDLAELRDRLAQEHSRLDELSAGDVDVRASIAASVTDLPPDSSLLFGRLSANLGGDWPSWTPTLLLGVDGDGVVDGEVDRPSADVTVRARRALDQLIDRHLVEPIGRDIAGQPRYRVHALVAELAREHLDSAEPDARAGLVRALVQAWLALARIADAELDPTSRPTAQAATPTGDGVLPGDGALPPGATQAAALPGDWFEAERDNLAAAVQAAVELDDREVAAALALAVRSFLTIRAYDAERERVLRIALDDYPDTADQRLSAQLLAALFGVLAQQHRNDELPEVARRFLDAARILGDDELEQRALSQLGWAALALNRFDEALDHYSLMGAVAERRGDADSLAKSQGQRGVVLRNLGRAAEGDPLLAAMVDAARRSGSRRVTCIWLVTRAEGLLDLDRVDEARRLLDEATGIATSLRDELGLANCRHALAQVHLARGDLDAARSELALSRPLLDARAGDGEDLDSTRLAADIAAAAGDWPAAAALLDRVVEGRRREADALQLAADLARAGRARAALTPPAGSAELAEAASILDDLQLPPAALRLPAHVWA